MSTGSGAAAPVGGIGGTASSALSEIGSDLTVSVSFNIATELLDSARDAQLTNEELISLMLGFTIVFSALNATLSKALSDRASRFIDAAKEAAKVDANGKSERDCAISVEEAAQNARLRLRELPSALDFLALLVGTVQRILVAVSIQLLAASVRAEQPSRLVRIISLCGLAVFFVFVEALTHRVVI
jgi:hypothetical protein